MGLKQDLIDAKKEGLRLSGADADAIKKAEETLEPQVQLEVDAIVNFLTQCEFRITQLNANVILEDFKIPPQEGNIEPGVQVMANIPVSTTGGPGSTTTPGILENREGGVLTNDIDVNKSGGETGNLESTGYVYIGLDPDSQDAFDVEDENGQKEFTTVKLFRDDIGDLL